MLLLLLLHEWLLAPSSISLLLIWLSLRLLSVNFAAAMTVPSSFFVDSFTGTRGAGLSFFSTSDGVRRGFEGVVWCGTSGLVDLIFRGSK